METLGGVKCNRVTHEVCWLLRQSANIRKGETSGVALFFGLLGVLKIGQSFSTSRIGGLLG